MSNITESAELARFSLHIQEKDEMELRPVFTEDGITFVYIKVNFDVIFIYMKFMFLGNLVQQFTFNGRNEAKFEYNAYIVLFEQACECRMPQISLNFVEMFHRRFSKTTLVSLRRKVSETILLSCMNYLTKQWILDTLKHANQRF